MNNFVLPFFVLFFLYILGECSLHETLSIYIIYCICFIIFTIRYELGYLHNDTITIKKEKNPTIRIPEKYPKNFVLLNFISRIILGILGIFGIYAINTRLGMCVSGLIVIMLVIYYIHNTIRKLNINYFTIMFLRLTKFFVFILVLYSLYDNNLMNIVIPLVSFFFLKELTNINQVYNTKFGGENKINILLVYISIAISQIMLYLLTWNTIYCSILIYLSITILHLGFFNKLRKK